MATTYASLYLRDDWFPSVCRVSREPLDAGQAKALVAKGVLSVCRLRDKYVLDALARQTGITLEAGARPEEVLLMPGDALLIVGVRDLSSVPAELTGYTDLEVRDARFEFGLWATE